MKDWFLSREPRERVVLVIGAVLAAAIVGWNLVWSPLASGAAQLRERVDTKESLLIDVQRAAAVAPETAASRPGADPPLLVLVDRTARGHALSGALTRTRPDGDNGINVAFQGAAFDALLDWLITLETEYSVSVETATVSASRQRGRVNGQVLLRRY